MVAPEDIPDNRIIPDAAFVLENVETGRRALFFVEMDMATERVVSQITRDRRITLHHRITQYDRYLQSGRFAQTYAAFGEFRFFTLLFVTFGAGRIDNIRKALADLPRELHAYYRFTTFEQAKADFFDAHWRSRSPDDPEGHMIVR